MDITKKIKILEFKLSKLLNWGLFWVYKSRFHWNWMEFAEHREYIFWDSVKDIDWKTSSKTNQMYVKKYEEDRDLNVLFLLDNSLSMNFWSKEITKKELLVDTFYWLALSAYFNNDNVWAFVFNEDKYEYIDYKKTKHNIFNILDKINYNKYTHWFTNESKKSWNKIESILKHINKLNIKNNLIFILTDETKIDDEKILKITGSQNEIIYINIFDYLENNISSIDSNISFSQFGNFLNINLKNKKKVEKYNNLRNSKIKDLTEIFRKNKVWYIKIDTEDDIFMKLIWYFYKVKN